eukprot:gene5818-6407_t
MSFEISAVTSNNVSFTVNFRGFTHLHSKTGQETISPIVELEGYRWSISIYPGGDREESKGYLSCYLTNKSQAEIKVSYSITM